MRYARPLRGLLAGLLCIGLLPGVALGQEATAPLAQLVDGDVVLAEPIRFQIEHAAVLPTSLPLIDALAALLLAHPELGVIQIEGHMSPETFEARRHMDNRLWLNRAREVRRRLVDRGVPAERLLTTARLTDALVCDPVALRGRRARACARQNDRIVLRRASP
jgi:hypothetical protein